MKLTKTLFAIGFAALLLGINPAYARTPLQGSALGEGIGRIHMDYTTALRPVGYEGPQENFYLSPVDPTFTGPGDPSFIAQIYDFEDTIEGVEQCDEEACRLTGFMWSDTIGWIMIEGAQIQSTLSDETGFGEAQFARIYFSGALSGYFWSQNTGWINLSSSLSGTTTAAADQTASDWGVFLDPRTEVVTLDSPEEEGEDLILGRTLQGYAWSQYLGWIKFGQTRGDSPEFGVFTNWVPDLSPPRLFAINNAWFANNHPEGVINWTGFAEDEESRIRDTRLTVTGDPGPDFANCRIPSGIEYRSDNEVRIYSIGRIRDTILGFCRYQLTGEITNNAGLTFQIGGVPPEGANESNYRPALTFSVRAGAVDETKTRLSPPPSLASVADGEDALAFTLELFDLAENPVVPVVCPECPSRQVTTFGRFNNQMRYDTTQETASSSPIKINGIFLEEQGSADAPPEGISATAEAYSLNITSFSPTVDSVEVEDNTLSLLSFEVTVEDEELLPVASTASRTPASTYQKTVDNLDINQSLRFDPGVMALNGTVSTSGVPNQIFDNAPALLSFQLQNQSRSSSIENLDIDTIFNFSGGEGADLLRTRQVDHVLSSDEIQGWSDPEVPGDTHYEIFNGSLPSGSPIDGATSLFRTFAVNPDGTLYPEILSPENGSYTISTEWDIPEEGQGLIDRSDSLPLSLASGALSDPAHRVEFTPFFLFPPPEAVSLEGVNLTLRQSLAYRYPSQPEFTVFEPEALATGITIETSEGAGFAGMGVGKSIFDGDLNVMGPEGVRGLKEQMRRNVAELTQNLTPCPPPSAPLRSLETTGDCVKVDDQNKTFIAYYQGTPETILTLGDGGDSPVFIPNDYRYTFILEGGMNLFIQNNLAYEPLSADSAFGMILLRSEGRGAHVYLSPEITNVVGNLFAEGSLLSSPDGRQLFYDGELSPTPLVNQLYWQGSLASLNTLGGSYALVTPEGISCTDLSPAQCAERAERYDLNFLRRFSLSSDGSTITRGGLFSGGGSCSPEGCTYGPLPSTLSLTPEPESKIDRARSLSTEAFFIEPTNRPAPPGFSVTSEQQSSQVIR